MDLHRIALGVHGFLAVWLLVNGVAHQLGVLIGAWRGTLRQPEDLAALLAVGAGLLVVGALVSWSLASLIRGVAGPSLAALFVLVPVVLLIAARYGWGFLGGTTLIAVFDLLALGALAASDRPQLG